MEDIIINIIMLINDLRDLEKYSYLNFHILKQIFNFF